MTKIANNIGDINLEELTRKLVDDGRLIEAGWAALRAVAIPKLASEIQLTEMRMAYFAGAQHLFASIMTILEPDKEPTDKDLARITAINDELNSFYLQLKDKNDTSH